MATLALQDASSGLGSVTLVAASAGGDQVPSGSLAGAWELAVVVVVRNAGLSGVTVTVDGNEGVVAAGGVGAFPARGGVTFGDLADITYSSAADVTVGAVRLAKL